jgi:hypothetical protein
MSLGTNKSFGNNLVLEKMDYRFAGNFTDENKFLATLKGSESLKRRHLGTLALFNQMQLVNTPLINMTELSKNTLYVNGDDGEFTFDVPYSLGLPTVKMDLTGENQRVGIDGQPFEAIIGNGSNDPLFSPNQTITADLRNGQEFIILSVGNAVSGGHTYKMALVTNNKEEYVDKKWLAVGTEYFTVSTVMGSYDEDAPGVNQSGGSMRLLHRIGAKRAVKMTITGGAQRLKLEGITGTGVDANAFEASVSPYLDPKNPDFMMAVGYNDGKGKIDKSRGVSIVTMYEILLYKELALQEERALMFGQGGVLQDQRNVSKYAAQGLYHQMKAGNWQKIPKWTLDVVYSIFSQVYSQRIDIAPKDRKVHFQCGMGAYIELSKICTAAGLNITNALGLLLDNSSLNIVKGSQYELEAGYQFGKVFLPGVGHLSFEHNAAIDAEFNRAMNQPMIGNLPKYSFTALVMDVTDGGATTAYQPSKNVEFAAGYDNKANIYLVKNESMPGIKVSYQNGRTSSYPTSAGRGNIVSTMFDGFTMFCESQSSVWLRDPTRSILIELE